MYNLKKLVFFKKQKQKHMEITKNQAVVNYRQFSSYKSAVVNYSWVFLVISMCL